MPIDMNSVVWDDALPASPQSKTVANPYNGKTYQYTDTTKQTTAQPPAIDANSIVWDKPRKEVGVIDRAGAAAAGVNKGFFSDLLGIPVDTAANVIDLAKAGVGYATSKVTGKAPPDWTAPYNREDVPGTADWIAKNINNGSNALGVASPINNPNPQDAGSRILYSGGRVAGASVVPNPRAAISGAQTAVNMAKGAVGGLAAGTVGEVAPEYAGVAGMLPQLAGAAAVGATRGISRGENFLSGSNSLGIIPSGGNSALRTIQQRIQDFKNAGVDNPSVGLATGNRGIMGIENLLSNTPGSVGVFEKNKLAMLEGMQNKTNDIRNSLSPVYGPAEAGAAIQADLKGAFKNRISNTYGALNDQVEQAVGGATQVPVNESILKSGQLTTPIAGAESTSSNFLNPRIAKINRDLTADSGGVPAQVSNSLIVGVDGKPAQTTITPATPPQGVPFSALKDLRTKIGKEAQSNAIVGTPEQADFKQLYGAMSGDMKNAVALSDLKNGVMPSAGGSATTALNRANSFYSNAMGRVEDLNSLANRSTPEGAYGSVANSLNSGPTTYARVRNVVTPETRGKVAATVVDDLGMATPGNQGASGDTWSPKTFLTNYSKLYENGGGQELFKRLPGGEKQAENLADIAKSTDMVSQGSKIWANPSGTSAALVAKGSIGAIGLGLAGGLFYTPLIVPAAVAAGGAILGNQVSKRLLLNPDFVDWLAKAKTVNAQDSQAYAQRLIAASKMTNDKQFQGDVTSYLKSVQQGQADNSDKTNK